MLLFEQKIIKSFHTIYITLRTGSYIKNMIGLIKTQTTLLKLLSTVLYKRDGTLQGLSGTSYGNGSSLLFKVFVLTARTMYI